MRAPDVAVIGGGIVGCSLAAFLAEGGLRVRLYELAAIASGASGRNSGIVQHPFDAVLAGLYRSSLGEYRALREASGGTFQIGDEPAGLLYVGRDRAAADRAARDWTTVWPATTPTVLSGAELTRLEPSLAPDLVACRLAVGFPVAPASATVAFAELARRRGVEIVIGEQARLAIDGDRIAGVVSAGRVDAAGAVVVAAGPWTPALVDPSGGWQPIGRSWGVVASVILEDAPRHGLEAIDITIEPSDGSDRVPVGEPAQDEAVEFSLVPAAGESALGSTFLPTEPEPAAWLEALRRVGGRYVPGVTTAPVVGLRHCARPVSRDGRPLVGAAPWAEGLWIVAGHGPWGISTGPGSARLVADELLGRQGASAIAPELAVSRFGVPGA